MGTTRPGDDLPPTLLRCNPIGAPSAEGSVDGRVAGEFVGALFLRDGLTIRRVGCRWYPASAQAGRCCGTPHYQGLLRKPVVLGDVFAEDAKQERRDSLCALHRVGPW